MSKHVHHLNDDGTAAVCTAPENAHCRMRPRCDSEEWGKGSCIDHGGAHRVMPSIDCWMVEWINGDDLEDSYGYSDAPPFEARPNAPVEVHWYGGYDGCSWDYAEVTP